MFWFRLGSIHRTIIFCSPIRKVRYIFFQKSINVFPLFCLLLTLNRFHTSSWCFRCCLWKSQCQCCKCRLGKINLKTPSQWLSISTLIILKSRVVSITPSHPAPFPNKPITKTVVISLISEFQKVFIFHCSILV